MTGRYYASGWQIGASVLPVWLLSLLNGFYLGALLKWSELAFWLQDIIHWVIVPSLVILLLHRRRAISAGDYGLPWPVPMLGDLVGLSILVAAVLFLVWFLPRNVASAVLGYPEPYFVLGDAIPHNLLTGPVVVYLALTAGVVETVFFIGLPWLAVKRLVKFPRKAAFAIASSSLFALTHWEQGLPNVVGTFFFGVVACAWYFKLRDLWPVVVAHTMIDLVAFW